MKLHIEKRMPLYNLFLNSNGEKPETFEMAFFLWKNVSSIFFFHFRKTLQNDNWKQ